MPNKKIRTAIFIPFDMNEKIHSGAARLEMFDYIKNIKKDIYYFGKQTNKKNLFSIGKYYQEIDWRYFLSLIKTISIFKTNKKYKAIWSTTPPIISSFIAVFIKKIFRVPLIIDVRDPLISGIAIIHGEKSWQFKIAKKIEKFVYKNADIICVVTPELKNYLIRTYQLENKKFEIISNATQIKIKKRTALNKKKISVFYAGNFAPYQIIDQVLESIGKNKKLHTPFQFNFFGFKKEANPKLTKIAEKYKINDMIKLIPPVSREKVFKELSSSDIALIPISGLNYQKYFEYAIPLKFYEATSFNKPILLFGGTKASQNLLEKNNLGVICKKNENIFNKLNQIVRNYDFFQKNIQKVSFLRKTEAKKLEKIIDLLNEKPTQNSNFKSK
jgi:glycosyltransferase involved in cell wall biosynthesis